MISFPATERETVLVDPRENGLSLALLPPLQKIIFQLFEIGKKTVNRSVYLPVIMGVGMVADRMAFFDHPPVHADSKRSLPAVNKKKWLLYHTPLIYRGRLLYSHLAHHQK